jgi:hypothetical protein
MEGGASGMTFLILGSLVVVVGLILALDVKGLGTALASRLNL